MPVLKWKETRLEQRLIQSQVVVPHWVGDSTVPAGWWRGVGMGLSLCVAQLNHPSPSETS
jgi:hypothetical protein